MRKLTRDEFLAELKLQGVPREHLAFKCPVCGTVQSFASLGRAGLNNDDVEKNTGVSCIGRFNGAGPWHEGDAPGKGCDWALYGLLHLHTLEVVDEAGRTHMHFEPATRDEAQALMVQMSAPPAAPAV